MTAFFFKAFGTSAWGVIADIAVYYAFFKQLPPDAIASYGNASTYIVLVLVLVDGQAVQIFLRDGVALGGISFHYVKEFLRAKVRYFMAGLVLAAASVVLLPSRDRVFFLPLLLYAVLTALDTVAVNVLRVSGRQSLANGLSSLNAVSKLVALAPFVMFSAGLTLGRFVGALYVAKAGYWVVLVSLAFRGAWNVSCESAASRDPVPLLKPRIRHLTMTSAGSFLESRLDWLILGWVASPLTFASYAFANKIFEVIRTFVSIGLTNVFTVACGAGRRAASLYLGLIGLSTVAFVSAGLLAPHIVALFGPEKYPAADRLIVLFMLAAPLCVVTGILYQQAVVRDETRELVPAQYGALGVQAAVNLSLIPRYGADAAVLGMACFWSTMILFFCFRLNIAVKLRVTLALVLCPYMAVMLHEVLR